MTLVSQMWMCILVGLNIITNVCGYSDGIFPCPYESMLPHHENRAGTPYPPQTTEEPYMVDYISVSDPRDPVTVLLKPKHDTYFRGFMLEARNTSTGDPVGTFTILESDKSQLLPCGNSMAVTQKNNQRKYQLSVNWTAPVEAEFPIDVTFRATVVQSYAVFWKIIPIDATIPHLISTTTPSTTTSTTQTSTTTASTMPSTTTSTTMTGTTTASTMPSTTTSTRQTSTTTASTMPSTTTSTRQTSTTTASTMPSITTSTTMTGTTTASTMPSTTTSTRQTSTTTASTMPSTTTSTRQTSTTTASKMPSITTSTTMTGTTTASTMQSTTTSTTEASSTTTPTMTSSSVHAVTREAQRLQQIATVPVCVDCVLNVVKLVCSTKASDLLIASSGRGRYSHNLTVVSWILIILNVATETVSAVCFWLGKISKVAPILVLVVLGINAIQLIILCFPCGLSHELKVISVLTVHMCNVIQVILTVAIVTVAVMALVNAGLIQEGSWLVYVAYAFSAWIFLFLILVFVYSTRKKATRRKIERSQDSKLKCKKENVHESKVITVAVSIIVTGTISFAAAVTVCLFLYQKN